MRFHSVLLEFKDHCVVVSSHRWSSCVWSFHKKVFCWLWVGRRELSYNFAFSFFSVACLNVVMWTRTPHSRHFPNPHCAGKETTVLVLCFSCSVVSDSATLWTVACQAPLSMGYFRYEYWSGLPLTAFMQLGWSQENYLHDVIVYSK